MAHSPPVNKAVIPAAGLGTRFVPATKAMPKEMLPVIDTPAIQYVVEEAAAAGLTDVLMVTARSKTNIEDHFDRNVELEEVLAAKGDEAGLASIRASNDLAAMHYVRQGQALGLGHAVLCAADHVGNEPFAVLLGDDFIDARDKLLQRMIEVRQQYGGSIVALMEVEPGAGVGVRRRDDQADRRRRRRRGHRPGGEARRSARRRPTGSWSAGTCATRRSSRCCATPRRAAAARSSSPTRCARWRGPTARTAARDGGGVHGVLFRGRRYDTGNKLDYLRTQIKFACERPDIAPEFVPWLRHYLETLGPAGSLMDSVETYSGRHPGGDPAAAAA